MLKNFGCTHYEAEDGTDCVSMYAKSIEEGGPTFDLVLMDFIMPSKCIHTCLRVVAVEVASIHPFMKIMVTFLHCHDDSIVMHGPDATAELRKAGYNGMVVGVTGNVLQDDIDYFLKCGADAVLSKPLNIPK